MRPAHRPPFEDLVPVGGCALAALWRA